jgi:chromosome segregation ATPase
MIHQRKIEERQNLKLEYKQLVQEHLHSLEKFKKIEADELDSKERKFNRFQEQIRDSETALLQELAKLSGIESELVQVDQDLEQNVASLENLIKDFFITVDEFESCFNENCQGLEIAIEDQTKTERIETQSIMHSIDKIKNEFKQEVSDLDSKVDLFKHDSILESLQVRKKELDILKASTNTLANIIQSIKQL